MSNATPTWRPPTPAEILAREHTEPGLLRRAIANAGNDSFRIAPRWGHVSHLFAVGAGVAMALCRKYGVDPDETVGRQLEMVGDACSLCGAALDHDEED